MNGDNTTLLKSASRLDLPGQDGWRLEWIEPTSTWNTGRLELTKRSDVAPAIAFWIEDDSLVISSADGQVSKDVNEDEIVEFVHSIVNATVNEQLIWKRPSFLSVAKHPFINGKPI